MEVLQGPNNEQLERIKNNLKEDNNRLEHTIRLFEQWIECQPHLPKNYDKELLPYYLRGCKHDFEGAKQKLEKYFAIKNTFPEVYSDREPNTKGMLNVTRCVSTVVLPKLTPSGDRVSVFRLLDPDPSVFDMKEIVKFIGMVADLRMVKEYPHCGELYIFDGLNMTGAHSVKLLSPTLKKVSFISREAYPIRLKQIHIINAPSMVEKMVTIAKSFMHEKFKSRFMIHKNLESLYEYVPRDILPVELGGPEGNLQQMMDDWHQCLIKNADWFQKQQSIKATGPIPKNLYQSYKNTDFGIEGSFRQLTID